MVSTTHTAPDNAWDLLIVAVAAYVLTAVGRIHQLFGPLELIRPALLTGLVAIVIYLSDGSEARRLARVWIRPTRFLLAFLVWMVLSIPGALVQGTSFDLVVNNFLKTVFMYFVVAGSVRGVRDVERLAIVYFAGAVIYAAVVMSRFDLGTGDAWRLGHLYYYDANDFATFAVTAMPLGLYALVSCRHMVSRVLAAAGLAVLAPTMVWTGSRGGFIALIAVAVYVLLRYRAVSFGWRLAATAIVTVLVLATATDQYWRQMGTIVSDADYNRTDETGRLQIWGRGVNYALAYPVLGLGPSNFPAAEGRLSPLAERQQLGFGVKWSAAHNSYIQVGAELGLPGLAFFIGILASAFAALARSGRQTSAWNHARAPQLAQALIAALIGFAVGAFFLSLAYYEMPYTLVALAAGLYKVTVNERELG